MLLKSLYGVVSFLPNRLAQLLGVLVGNIIFYTHIDERHIAEVNIALCFPELSLKEQYQLVKKSLVENAKTLLEMPKIFRLGGDYSLSLIKAVDGIELYHEAIKAKKGVILLAPHLGNWELTVHYLNQFSPIVAMFAPPRQPFLNDIMKKARQSSGAILVPADPSGVRAQLKQLKQGGTIGVLPDQLPKSGHGGVFSSFMGNDAYTMLLINSLAKRVDATIIYTFAERLGIGQGYKLHLFTAPDGLNAQDEERAAAQLNVGIENCVRIAPAQYQWTYKRFRKQPKGKPSPYQ